jgi:beta-barrel assembly-enhancing protease
MPTRLSVASFLAAMFVFAPALAQAPPPRFELSGREIDMIAKMADVERMMDRRGQVAADEELRAYVASVAEPLIPPDFRDPRLTIRFKLHRAAEPNAFALPNGSIYVSLGLVAQLENEAQLAAVLAHEIAHVTKYHAFRFDRDYRSTSVMVNLLGLGAAVVGGWGALLTQVGVESLAVGALYGYSRDLEEEADRLALGAVATGGYDPGQIPALFGRLMIDYDGTHIEAPLFYSDHPKLQSRIEYTTRLIKEKGLAADPSQAQAERYQPFRQRGAREAVRLAIRDNLPRTAIAWAAEMIRRLPQAAEPHYLKAEAHRALGSRPQDLLTHPPSKDEKQREASKQRRKTPAEIEAELAATPQGRIERQKNSDAALAEYTTATELEPAFAPAHAGMAQVLATLGRFAEAVAAADRFLALAGPDDKDRARVQRLRDEWKAKERPPTVGGATRGLDATRTRRVRS